MGFRKEGLKTRHLRITSARKDQTCSPLDFRTVNHAAKRKSMGPDPNTAQLHRLLSFRTLCHARLELRGSHFLKESTVGPEAFGP